MTKCLQEMRRKTLLLSFLMVIFVMLSGFIWNEKTVSIQVDGQEYTITTHLNAPKGIVREAGITLADEDVVTLSTKSLENGTLLTVYRAFPVTVVVDGTSKIVKTVQTDATALAKELGYEPSKFVVLENSADKLQSGSSITIAQITGRKVETSVKPVEIKTIRQADDKMFKGEEVLLQDGQVGTVKVQEEILYVQGVAVKRNVLSETVLEEMKPRIVREGSRDFVETSRGNERFSRKMVVEATAYLPTDGDGRGITATGIRAVRGVVAVDPDVIPLGTRMYIPGYGMAVAADTGGAIIGAKVDLLMEDYNEAIQFGRRDIEVYILH